MRWRLFTLFLMTAVCWFGAAHASPSSDTVMKARLQAAMQQHIERRSVNGAILRVDLETGDVSELYPGQAHSMMFRMGEYFVLCAELRDRSGTSVPFDVFLAPQGAGFTVFHSEIDNRGPIEAMIGHGVLELF